MLGDDPNNPGGYPVDGTPGTNLTFGYLSKQQQAALALGMQGSGTNQPEPLGPNVQAQQPMVIPPDAPDPGATPGIIRTGPGAPESGTGFGSPAWKNANMSDEERAHGANYDATGNPVLPPEPSTEPAHFQNPKDLLFGDPGRPAAPPVPLAAKPTRAGGGGEGDDLSEMARGGIRAETNAAFDAARVAGWKGDAEKKILNSGIDDQQKRLQWQDLHQQEMKDFVDQHTQKLNGLMQDFRATAKVNPNAYWDNQSTGQKIGNVLAIILSGLGGGGVGSQKNAAQEVIDNGVKNNIAAQMENIKNKKSAIDDENNLVAQYMKNGMDINQAASAAAATQKLMIHDKLDANAAGFARPQAMANAQQFKGEHQASLATDLNGFKNSTVSRAVQLGDLDMKKKEFGLQMENREGLRRALQGGAIDDTNPEIAAHLVSLPNGRKVIAARPEDAEKGRGIVQAGVAYDNALSRVAETAQKAGANPFSGAADENDLAVNEAKAAARTYFKVKGSGGKEGGDEASGLPADLLTSLAGGGHTDPIRKAKTLARIHQLQADHRADMQAQLRANNIRLPVEPQFSPLGGGG
jgi:hypothetical protein